MGAFRKGVLIGFAAGYVQGSKAGRERYEQINRSWKKVKTTPTYQMAAATASSVVGTGIQRGKNVALDAVSKASQRMKNPLARKVSVYGAKNGSHSDL